MFKNLTRLNKFELDEKLGEVIPKNKLKDMVEAGARKEWKQNGYSVAVDRTKSETVVVLLSNGEDIYIYA